MGTVRIRAYLAKLCETITASMIVDQKALVLEVVAADVVVDAGHSVSLGLIVTELVINALKHAFPDGASGRIVVDFQVEGVMWTLCVRDNGVGMPAEADKATAGLGSSIIDALARQLKARVAIEPTHPGLKVSIISETDGAGLLGPLGSSETAVQMRF
jgi:two-component sensor histidine kinase